MGKADISIISLANRIQTEADAYLFLEELRWGDRPVCPHCGSHAVNYIRPLNGVSRKTRTGAGSQRRVWKCQVCPGRKQFSVLTGTIFHGSKISVRTWLFVIFEMCASKNGVAAREIERKYDLTAKSAWFMLHRIREAMKREPLAGVLRGTVVADETFIGGKLANMHESKRASAKPKVAVLTLIDKESGEARSRVVPNIKGRTLKRALQADVHHTAILHTDSAGAYPTFGHLFAEHHTVNHTQGEYVRDGKIGTNDVEGYFSQLKRSIDGTHHHVSEEHLERYLAEFDYRYSTRRISDTARTERLIGQVGGRRLSYRPATGRP